MLATFFVAVAALAAAATISVGGTSMITPAFAQAENMTDGGNYTEGNMTGSDMAGSGLATPPIMTP